LFVLFCFAKKEQKKATENDYILPLFAGQAVFGEELRLSFSTTVVNSICALIGSTSANEFL